MNSHISELTHGLTLKNKAVGESDSDGGESVFAEFSLFVPLAHGLRP